MRKLVKSALLASFAILTVGVGVGVGVSAQAADLPANKSAPLEYVRVCDAYGSGFFYIPGTDTCLRVGGYARFEYRYSPGQNINNIGAGAPKNTGGPVVSQIAGAQDQTGMQVRGRIDVDARTQTAWGTVQTVVHLRATNSDGLRSLGKSNMFEPAFTPVGNASSTITMERAYIRFAGLTAGVSSENFTTMPSYMYGPTLYAGFPNGVKQLDYTATFGNGFSATLAIESKGDFESTAVSAADGAISAVNPPVPYAYGVEYANQWDSGYILVGNVRYDSNWGYFQANGAVTENTVDGVNLGGLSTNGTSTYNPLDGPTGLTAWAAGASFRYNLPLFAPGDQFHFQFAYDHGIQGLVQSSGALNDISDSSGSTRWLGGIITVPNNLIATSAAPGGVVTSVAQTSAYQVFGMLTHYWAPQWRTNAQVGYEEVLSPTAALSAGVQEGNAKLIDAGANLIWSPTKNFDIGVELDYMHLSQTIQNAQLAGPAWVAAGMPGLTNSNWMGTLRLQRQF